MRIDTLDDLSQRKKLSTWIAGSPCLEIQRRWHIERLLQNRNEEAGRHNASQVMVARVLGNTHDFETRPFIAVNVRHMFADRIAIPEKQFCECLIDDANAQRSCLIPLRYPSAQQDGYPERRKVVWPDLVPACAPIVFPAGRVALNFYLVARFSA